jgi:hypothetical protein
MLLARPLSIFLIGRGLLFFQKRLLPRGKGLYSYKKLTEGNYGEYENARNAKPR